MIYIKIREKSKVIFLCLGAMILFLLVLNVSGMVINKVVGETLQGSYVVEFISEFLAMIVSLGMLKLAGKWSTITQQGLGWRQSVVTGGFLVCYCGYVIVGMLFQVFFSTGKISVNSWLEIFCFCATMLCIGIAEEVVFRGVVLNLLLDVYPNTSKGILWAVMIEGILFGGLHLVNLFAGARWISVIVQMITAAALGILFSIVYIRTNNLWYVIVIHALVDFAALMPGGIFGQGDMISGLDQMSLANLVMVPILMVPILILTREPKMKEIVILRCKETDFELRKEQVQKGLESEVKDLEYIALTLGIVGTFLSFFGIGIGFGITGICAASLARQRRPEQNYMAFVAMTLSMVAIIVGIFATVVLCAMRGGSF